MQLHDLNVPVVAALKARLDSDLATAIALVNADSAIDIEAPQLIVDFVPPLSLITAFPTVGIGDGPIRFEDDNAHSATIRSEVMLIAYLQNADQAVLASQLRAYARALVSCALDGRTLGTGAWGTGLIQVDPGPTLTDNPDKPKEFASWVAVRMWAKSEQE